ncbi:MAG: cupin domain-containing protein [Patescibacteria group bacterium]
MPLRKLFALTVERDPEKKGVQPAQISRIERGALCDVRELYLLALALNIRVETLLSDDVTPWFLVRRSASEPVLAEVSADEKSIESLDGAHKKMIESRVYSLLPLNAASGLVNEKECEGGLSQHLMRKYLFRVGRCNEKDMVLDNHAGEEIVWVIEGELEFWARQPITNGPERRLTLQPGDCLHYSSALFHGYRATGDCEYALALLVSTRQLLVFAEETFVLKSVTPPDATSD